MAPPHSLKILVLFTVVSRGYGGILDMFNDNSDYNLAYSLDTVFGALRNDISSLLDDDSVVPIEKDVTFWCKNSSSSILKQTYLNDADVKQKIVLTKPMTFIVHGWLDNVTQNWAQEMVRDVLKYTDSNVCLVDWSRLAQYNYYRTALNHTMIVSGYLTKFIVFLESAGIPLDKVTLVGHSMGAQISGQVGYNLGGRIGKIYGLDPAGPCFTAPRDRGLKYRLDKSDARYVQTIVTSRYTIGVGQGDGHENFYPNGGESPQPNCVFPITSDAEFADQVMCSHLHSRTLFRLALNPSNVYRGRRCAGWPMYVLGLCGWNLANVLGVASSKQGGDFYLRTSVLAPYISDWS